MRVFQYGLAYLAAFGILAVYPTAFAGAAEPFIGSPYATYSCIQGRENHDIGASRLTLNQYKGQRAKGMTSGIGWEIEKSGATCPLRFFGSGHGRHEYGPNDRDQERCDLLMSHGFVQAGIHWIEVPSDTEFRPTASDEMTVFVVPTEASEPTALICKKQ